MQCVLYGFHKNHNYEEETAQCNFEYLIKATTKKLYNSNFSLFQCESVLYESELSDLKPKTL